MTYSRKLARLLGAIAIAIYRESNGFPRWCRANGFAGGEVITRGATQVGVAYSPDLIVVSPRGSSQILDWFCNFLFLRWPWLLGWIHCGFLLQLKRRHHGQSAEDELLETLRGLIATYRQAKIMITGHSLGGALATLLTVILDRAGIVVEVTYTFESPRVGNRKFRRLFDALYKSRVFRVVMVCEDEQDIVTRLPFSWMGWEHVGEAVVLCNGEALIGEEVWNTYRRDHPISFWLRLRFLTRLWYGINAHLGTGLNAELERQAA